MTEEARGKVTGRNLTYLGRLAPVVIGVLLASVAVLPYGLRRHGVSPQADSRSTRQNSPAWVAPRTAWGDPDLQGIWNNQADAETPFERPDEFEGRETISEQEARELLT